ncbi:MAG: anti-sigma factor family protein [Desulfurivibrionaceae bacterium]
MHCKEVKLQLDALDWTEEIDPGGDLRDHLNECDACRDYARERRLVNLLASLPVRQPAPGFEDRVIRKALTGKGTPRMPKRWALATAAGIFLAVLLTLQFYPGGGTHGPVQSAQNAVVEVQPQETRMVNLRLTSPRNLSDALITVELDDNLELEGYRGVNNLQWRSSFQSGENRLALPVRLLEKHSGKVTVVLEHGGVSRRFSVLINAVSDDERETITKA